MTISLQDGGMFDIRRVELFPGAKAMRLMVSHTMDPLPGTLWSVANSDRQSCWNLPPFQGGRKVALLPSADKLIQIFNVLSAKTNTSSLPIFLRSLVKSGQFKLKDVIGAVMQNKPPVGIEKEWNTWKSSQGRDESWEIKGVPRVAKTLHDLSRHLKPLESGQVDLNETVRLEFGEAVQRASGLTLDEAMEYALSGGQVMMRGGIGGGWFKVTVGKDLTKHYVINLHEEEDDEHQEEEDDDDKSMVKMRGWWQVMDVSTSVKLSDLRRMFAVTVAMPGCPSSLDVEQVHLMYARRPLHQCAVKDELHAEGVDLILQNTLISEVEGLLAGKDPVHKPRAFCYVCGLVTVTPGSLRPHLKACGKTFVKRQALLPPEHRRRKPSGPKLPLPTDYGPLLDAWNREAALIYLLETSPRCPHCGRSYQQPDTLDKHMQFCCPHLIVQDVARGLALEVREAPEQTQQDHSRSEHSFALCYICNRFTGIASLAWHLRSCAKKFEYRQKELPTPLKRDLPEPPDTPLPTALEDVSLYNEEASVIHQNEVRPNCPACGELLSDVVADQFGFSIMKHMSFCCPDLLHTMQDSMLPPVKKTRTGVMGAICLLCNGQFGLAGYGWHLAACYRKYRNRESGLRPHEKRWHFYIRARVRTSLTSEPAIKQTLLNLFNSEPMEKCVTLVGAHQIELAVVVQSEIAVVEGDVIISNLSSLDVARLIKKRLTTSSSLEFLVVKSYISRALPPFPPGAPETFNPERAWETQWDDPPPPYTQSSANDATAGADESLEIGQPEEVVGEEEEDDDVGDDDDEGDDEAGEREEMDGPPSYEESASGWLPRSYGYELDEFNRKVLDIRSAWLPFCPLCNISVEHPQDVTSFSNDESLRIHMNECCPSVLIQQNEIRVSREEKTNDFNGKPFGESLGIVCYLCGERTVGLTSFPWHFSACVRVWYVAELCKPKRQRRDVPRLPSHVKLPFHGETDSSVYSEQVASYNREALKLFNSVGTLQCPKCLKSALDSSSVYPTTFALLQHMDKCCAELIPGDGNANLREALERMESHVELMGCIAEHCEQQYRKSKGPAHIGILCHLCNKPSASLAGLEFHRRACMRAWDRLERAERLPHRRRLFSWKKDETQLQEQGERYGQNKFYWDVPRVDINPSGFMVDCSIELRTPKPRSHPGPVPRPPSTPLPAPPSLRSKDTTSFPDRSEYLKIVERYNKQASQIYTDWQPRCPNFEHLIVKLSKQQCLFLRTGDTLKELGLLKFDSKMSILEMRESSSTSLLQSAVKTSDTLWSASVRHKAGWITERLCSEEAANDIIRRFANLVTSTQNNEDEEDDQHSVVLYLRRGCNQSYATSQNLQKHMQKCCPGLLAQLISMDEEIPNPKRDQPVDETTLPGTTCFICSRRVLYLGSLPRHTARCLEAFDAKELNKTKALRDKPPIPPEQVYGFKEGGTQLEEMSSLRVTVKRFKAGHRYISSENEWKYDVAFTFFSVLPSINTAEAHQAIVQSFNSVQFTVIKVYETGLGADYDDEDSDDDEDDDDDDGGVEVLVVTRSSCIGDLILNVGDQVVVRLRADGVNPGECREVRAMETLAVAWPPPSTLPALEALRLLQPLIMSGDSSDDTSEYVSSVLSRGGYSVHVQRQVNSPIDRNDLWCSMKAALTEWGVRCSQLALSKQPRCGMRYALQRTLETSQLPDISFALNDTGSAVITKRVNDDEGALLAGDVLVSYSPSGKPLSSLAHGVNPQCLLASLRQKCRQSKQGEVVLNLIRTGLRPAFALGLRDTGWCESIEKRPDDMTEKEVKACLARLRNCGLEEAVDDGDRIQRRDRLKKLLQGGCGRSFSTQIAVFKHMKDCCLDVIDPALLDEDPLEAASRTLGVQSDAGLGGVDSDTAKYPFGQPGWICHLCGERTLSLQSFKFHLQVHPHTLVLCSLFNASLIQSCARAWDNYELGKHPSRWRVPPKPPTKMENIPAAYGADLASYNNAARAIFTSILACCQKCAKTFKSEDALDRHMQACCPDLLASLQPELERFPKGTDYSLPCHICGRPLVSAASLKRHLKTCLRAWYRREKDGKSPLERLDPPEPPKLPIPSDKQDIPAYRASAIAIFEASLPRCGLHTKFPVNIKSLKKWETELFGDQFGDDTQQKLLHINMTTRHIVADKVSKDFTRMTGVRRYDRLLAIVTEDGDWVAEEGVSLGDAFDVFASTTDGFVWFERCCTLSFQNEVKRDKHRVSCRTSMLAGLLIPTEVYGDRPAENVQHVDMSQRSLYRAYGVTDGRNQFVDTVHGRVPVLGDPHSLHAPGAGQRKQRDKQIAKENAKIACRLASTKTTIAKHARTNEFSRSKSQAVKRHETERINRENTRLGKKLRALYGKHVAVNKSYGGVVGDAVRVCRYYEGYAHSRVDGIEEEGGPGPLSQVNMWEGRTRIYHNPLAVKQLSIKKVLSRKSDTPKTLGVAACSACGRKRFHDPESSATALVRCKPVMMPELPDWLSEEGSFAERLQVALKLLRISTVQLDPQKPVFGGQCAKHTDISDIPWYCDDRCAVAGWLTHFKVCGHHPKFNGHGGYAAKPEDPWVLKGSRYPGGLVGEVRRFLLRARCVVEYPSGQKETVKELDRLVKGRKGDPIDHHEEGFDWMRKGVLCRLRLIAAAGTEKLVAVKLIKVVLKPCMKELMEELGRLVIEDQDLLAKVKGKALEEEELEEGLRCYYCYDEIHNDETFNQHVEVCARRWRRMEALKPPHKQRPEPKPPTHMERPTNINDTESVTKWAAAAKDAMGPRDEYNPNGGGALQRYEEAEERASGVAAIQQLNIALDHMDKTVLSEIKALDDLKRRIAWEGSGGGSVTALASGTALDSEKYGEDDKKDQARLAKTHARTARLAAERDQISKPRPISDDVMGEAIISRKP